MYGLPVTQCIGKFKETASVKGMSLDQVAEQTGVSKSMLAQIEKGTANPSLGVLGKITSGLRIEFQTLIEAPRVDFCLVKPEEMIPTKELEGQYKVFTCFPFEDSQSVEIYRIDVELAVYTPVEATVSGRENILR